MKITYLPIEKLTANSWNPNKLETAEQEKLTLSIKKDGLLKAIAVREIESGYEIVDGYHRFQSLIDLGEKTVPCVNLGKIEDEKAKKFTLIGNNRYGEDDPFLLKNLISTLDVQDLIETLPFEESDISNIFANNILDVENLDIDTVDPNIDFSMDDLSSYQTHTILRFKVDLETASKINDAISKVKKQQGYSESDEITNSGDALSFILRENGII